MAVGNNELQVLWGEAASKSVAAAATEISDAISFSATTIAATVTLKADNAGTPSSGDTVDVYALLSAGDPDGASDAEFPAVKEHGLFLFRLNTYGSGFDPAVATTPLTVGVAVKLLAVSNAASNAIVVSACINEKVVT
jgi:hypothetical protein